MDIGAKVQPLPTPAGNTSRPDAGFARKSEVVQGPVEIPSVPNVDIRAADQRRLATIQQNLRSSDLFVVSDRTFTIYKDTSGQYITRYTSLRDGSITYVPEAQLTATAPDPMLNLDA